MNIQRYYVGGDVGMQWSDLVRHGYNPDPYGQRDRRPVTAPVVEPEQPPLMQGLFPATPATTPAAAPVTTPSGITSLDPNLPLPYYGYNVPTAPNVYPGYSGYNPTQEALEILAPGSTLLRQGYSLYQPDMTNFLQQEIQRSGGIT